MKVRLLNSIILCFILAQAISCGNKLKHGEQSKLVMDVKKSEEKIVGKALTYLDLVKHWKSDDNGHFALTKKIDEFTFTAIYKPYSILLLEGSEKTNMNDVLSSEFREKTHTYDNMHFFNFNISHDTYKSELLKLDLDNSQAYYDRITYYSFEAKNDAYVIEGNDTLKCDFVNFERTYDINPSIMISLAFSRKSKLKTYTSLKFVFEDKIFNKGKLNFNYDIHPILLLNYLKPIS